MTVLTIYTILIIAQTTALILTQSNHISTMGDHISHTKTQAKFDIIKMENL
jgi:hypothetical protein